MELFDLDLLNQLTLTPGLPGREQRVAGLIQENISSPWQVNMDSLGNIIAHLPGKGKSILLIAHMDEVGLIVQRITQDGFLKVERMGGMSLKSLPGSQLDLWTEGGPLPALAGVMPQHLDGGNTLEWEDIFIDIGARSYSEAHRWGVRIGNGLTWTAPVHKFGDNCITGKALDDRLGCFILLALAKTLPFEHLNVDLYLGFTIQEETTLMGGAPIVNTLNPDYVIGVDGTLAFDTPDLEGKQCDLRLGNGPGLKIMDTIRGRGVTYVPDADLAQSFRNVAQEYNISIQEEVISGLSTAVAPLPFVSKGAKTAALSIPIRYHHSPIETADMADVSMLYELLLKFISFYHDQ